MHAPWYRACSFARWEVVMRTLIARRSATTNTGFVPRGYLHISGEFASAHESDLVRLLRCEEHRAHDDSPAARIPACDDDGSGGMLLTTTTEHLAHRLGRALEQRFGGTAHHGFSNNNKLALVWWRR
jgi:hypothetical protein